jgi:fluoride exporter
VALLIVMIGGAAGVAARAALLLLVGDDGHPLVVPSVTMAINILGAFLLGVLSGRLGERRRGLRLFVGTGFLGGFTTYSAFAVHTLEVFTNAPIVGILFVGFTLLGGVFAAGVGLVLGTREEVDA